MASSLDLGALNKSSARIASFVVAVTGGRVIEYTFTQKKDGKTIHAHRFETRLVGMKAESYCIGSVKGSAAACKSAAEEFVDGSTWTLSKAALDTYTSPSCISTPNSRSH